MFKFQSKRSPKKSTKKTVRVIKNSYQVSICPSNRRSQSASFRSDSIFGNATECSPFSFWATIMSHTAASSSGTPFAGSLRTAAAAGAVGAALERSSVAGRRRGKNRREKDGREKDRRKRRDGGLGRREEERSGGTKAEAGGAAKERRRDRGRGVIVRWVDGH